MARKEKLFSRYLWLLSFSESIVSCEQRALLEIILKATRRES